MWRNETDLMLRMFTDDRGRLRSPYKTQMRDGLNEAIEAYPIDAQKLRSGVSSTDALCCEAH